MITSGPSVVANAGPTASTISVSLFCEPLASSYQKAASSHTTPIAAIPLRPLNEAERTSISTPVRKRQGLGGFVRHQPYQQWDQFKDAYDVPENDFGLLPVLSQAEQHPTLPRRELAAWSKKTAR